MVAEGHAREATRRIQQFRKDSGLEISDRINLELYCEKFRIGRGSYKSFRKDIRRCIGYDILVHQRNGGTTVEDVNGLAFGISISVV